MSDRFVKIWVFVAIILPALVGYLLVANPNLFLPAGVTVGEIAKTLGFHNFAFSLLLLYAFFRKHMVVVGYFLILRGMLEVADALSTTLAGNVSGAIFPVLAAFISFWAAKYLLRRKEDQATKPK